MPKLYDNIHPNKKVKLSSIYGYSPKLYPQTNINNAPKFKIIQWGQERSIVMSLEYGENNPIIMDNTYLMNLDELGQIIWY